MMLKQRRTLWIIGLSCLLFVLLTIRTSAQDLPPSSNGPDIATGAGTYLTYQGRLTDKGGNPVETPVQMVFRLYNTSGDVIYTSATRTVTPTQGMFTAYIGASPDPMLERWMLDSITEIGVTINDDSEMSPRQSFNSLLGSSDSGVGVAGNSASGVGVYGVSQSYYGVHGVSQSGSAVHGHSNNGVGVSGYSNSADGVGVKGDNGGSGVGVSGWSAQGTGISGYGSDTGVRGGSETGVGVSGHTSSTTMNNAAVFGNNSGVGPGVSGLSSNGPGVFGNSINNIGVSGYTSSTNWMRPAVYGKNGGSGAGIYGVSVSGTGVAGETNSAGLTTSGGVSGYNSGTGPGVYAWSMGGSGVYAGSTNGIGVNGYTSSTTWANVGVKGENGGSGAGVYGISASGTGVAGETNSTGLTAGAVSGYNRGTGPGVYAWSNGGFGVYGGSTTSYGVWGDTDNAYAGVRGTNGGTGPGVHGESTTGNIGVSGYTSNTSMTSAGVVGENGASGSGVYGESSEGTGVYGYSPSFIGVGGDSDTGFGMWTISRTGIGIFARTITGTAASYFRATNPTTATSVFVNEGAGRVLYLENGGADGDGSGGGDFIEAVSSSGEVQFRVTTSGTVQADGGHTTPAADFAEMLPAGSDVEPGDVLIIGLDGKLHPSTDANQPTVVGVHSTRPGFVGGKGIDDAAEGKVPLAIMGVVPVKVSAENGAIQPGDLLVASDTLGHAMRASASPANGTVIGKALGALAEGTGVIQMLVMLQ